MIVMPARPRKLPSWIYLALTVIGLSIITALLGIQKLDAKLASTDLVEYLGRFRQLNVNILPAAFGQMGITVCMAVVGTLLGLGLALTILPLTLRFLDMPRYVQVAGRTVFLILRAIPDSIFAVVILMFLGVGPQGGALALAFHSAGFMGKSLYDSMDRLPKQSVAGVQACGANRIQSFMFGVVPQALPEASNLLLYTLDRNTRMAAVLGIVGSGGIGLMLKQSLDSFHYEDAASALLILLVAILIMETASGVLRAKFVQQRGI